MCFTSIVEQIEVSADDPFSLTAFHRFFFGCANRLLLFGLTDTEEHAGGVWETPPCGMWPSLLDRFVLVDSVSEVR